MGEVEVKNLAKLMFFSPLTEGESEFKIKL